MILSWRKAKPEYSYINERNSFGGLRNNSFISSNRFFILAPDCKSVLLLVYFRYETI